MNLQGRRKFLACGADAMTYLSRTGKFVYVETRDPLKYLYISKYLPIKSRTVNIYDDGSKHYVLLVPYLEQSVFCDNNLLSRMQRLVLTRDKKATLTLLRNLKNIGHGYFYNFVRDNYTELKRRAAYFDLHPGNIRGGLLYDPLFCGRLP